MCNPVSPILQILVFSYSFVYQSIASFILQLLLTFAATKVHFPATATHFSHLFSPQKPSNYMIINICNFYFHRFSATATHFGDNNFLQSLVFQTLNPFQAPATPTHFSSYSNSPFKPKFVVCKQ
jgi:hypothetical protein